jgi:hypothetical protein
MGSTLGWSARETLLLPVAVVMDGFELFVRSRTAGTREKAAQW